MPLVLCDRLFNTSAPAAHGLVRTACIWRASPVKRQYISQGTCVKASRPKGSHPLPQLGSVSRVSEPRHDIQQPPRDHWHAQQRQPDWRRVLVVVEGLSDLRAVQRAVPARAFVLHGASKVALPTVQNRLLQLAKQTKYTIALLDPDVAGRQSRLLLDRLLPGQVLHAFMPGSHATACSDIRQKKAGNVGVEHATPDQIREALLSAHESTVGRAEFDRADLLEWGLSVDMGTPLSLQGSCVQRRAAVCFMLGLGNCDGKQLLKQLNLYNFSRQDVLRAVRSLDDCVYS